MSDVLEEQEPQPPRGHVRVVYLGPVTASHGTFSPTTATRLSSTNSETGPLRGLTLLPPHDPQFRRNRERVVRDANAAARTRVGSGRP